MAVAGLAVHQRAGFLRVAIDDVRSAPREDGVQRGAATGSWHRGPARVGGGRGAATPLPTNAPWKCVRGPRDTRGIIRSQVGVKSWAAQVPCVEQVRPARCPACGAASRPVGAALVLHGHGVRERQVLGPVEWGEVPLALVVGVRRYLCTACQATCTVCPREVLTQRLYSAPAIALALALFGLLSRPAAQVRAQVSPWRVVGHGSVGRWCALCAWVRALPRGGLFRALPPCPEDWSLRRIASRAAAALAARAPEAVGPSPPPLHVLAPLGAAHAG